MQTIFETQQLLLTPLRHNDYPFILALLNSPGWLEFIGDRNVRTETQALAYIEQILEKPDVIYWVARPKNGDVPAGIITQIQRQYLEHPDIGFAFLPEFNGKGYAQEAAHAILQHLLEQHERVLAITVPENRRSIQLLEKIGLRFSNTIEVEDETLLVYAISQ